MARSDVEVVALFYEPDTDRMAVRTDFVGYGRGSGAKTELTGGGTAAKFSDRGLVTWQGWFVDQGGWEQALQAVGLSDPVT